MWESRAKKRILFLADRNILIEQTMVNDFSPFKGAALGMKVAQSRITFEANLVATRSHGLKLSARMLSLATEVLQ